MTGPNMITGIPLRSLGCQLLCLHFILITFESNSGIKIISFFFSNLFSVQANELCIRAHKSAREAAPAPRRGHRVTVARPSNVISFAHNGIDFAKMARVSAATDLTMQCFEKTNNRIEIENRASFQCNRTGFWKSGFSVPSSLQHLLRVLSPCYWGEGAQYQLRAGDYDKKTVFKHLGVYLCPYCFYCV